jgi:NAD-dependent dihydropyrimidine dehydrogenase PreA subunit
MTIQTTCCPETTCCAETTCACGESAETGSIQADVGVGVDSCVADGKFVAASSLNTLSFNAERCINCGMCSAVCPHGVFMAGERIVRIVRPDACMECGACRLNCPVGALQVNSGVGCAAAMIYAALRGLPAARCGGDGSSCCG